MADGQLILPPDSTGQILDVEELTVGVDTVIRERTRVAGAGATDLAPVSATQGLMVQFGPTDNAVLDAIAASVAAIDVDTSTIAGNQLPDGHSVALSATDNAVLDAIAASVAAIDTDTTTIIGHVDGVEALLTTIDADTSNLSVVGGGTEAAAIRVTIANNSTGVLSVDDNGSSLTVDGTVTAAGDVGTLDQLDLTNTNPLAVAIVDGDGTQITSFGGGTQYTEGDTDASITGTALLFEGAADGLVAATGTAANGLDVDVTRVSGTVTVDGSGVTQPVSGTVTANLSATDNAVLDQIELNTDPLLVVGSGVEATAIRVTIATDSTGVLSVDDNGSSLTVDGTVAVSLADVVGSVADDATTPGDPVMIGGMAKSPDGTDPGSVSAENDVARVYTDLNRRLLVSTKHPRHWHFHSNGSTALTDQSVQADPGDGFQIVITSIQFTSGAATAINMFLEEGASTIWGPIYLEAVAGRGYVSGPIELHVTASTAVTVTTSAAIAHSVDIIGYIQAV